MDPAELAALNAIINTRRSMATAKALAQRTAPVPGADASKELLRTYSLPATMPGAAAPLPSATVRRASEVTRRIRFAPLPEPADEACADESALLDEEDADPEPSRRLGRSLSTGSLGLRTPTESHRRSMDDEERGRPLRAWRRARNTTPSPSRTAAPRTPEERLRRRELIRASRPGGTGMVTLLNGERIKARMVGDPHHERVVDQDIQDQLWGFAALERARASHEAGAGDGAAQGAGRGADDGAARGEARDVEDGAGRGAARDAAPALLPPLVPAADAAPAAGAPRRTHAADAAEMQRRYEDEVVALGAEVLAHVHRDRKADVRRTPAARPRGRARSGASEPMRRSHSVPGTARERASDEIPEVIRRLRAMELVQSFETKPDPSVSIPLPLRSLPRRPDAVGISVAPLPQLGRRPERPREGRVWASWELSDSESEDEAPAARPLRATARAAEQEVVHGRHLARGGSRPWAGASGAKHAAVRVAAHYDDDDEFWPAPSATRRVFAPRPARYSGPDWGATRMYK